MIGKVITGPSFYNCIRYVLEDKRTLSAAEKERLSALENVQHRDRAEVLEYNKCFGDKWELTEQFTDVSKLSKRVEKPVFHLTIRASPGDQLTREQWVEIGQAAAKEFGLTGHQYICVLHQDTQQPHIHIVGNRVGYDGKVASDSQSYGRMAALCRRQEQKYQLRQVLSPRRYLSPKERLLPRHDQRKELLKTNIREALKGSRTYPEFEKNMQEKGYRVEKGRGIAFEDNKKVRVKGSEVGYSLSTIERILAQNQREVLRQSKVWLPSQQKKIQPLKKKIGSALGRMTQPVPEGSLSATVGKVIGNGLSELFKDLLKPLPEQHPGMSIWEAEELRKKKRKQHLHH